jgi:hypothetical protein
MDMVKQKMDKSNHAGGGGRRRNCRDMPSVRQVSVTTSTITSNSVSSLMEQVVEQSNMQRAWSRVKSNKGSAGVDGLAIGPTAVLLKEAWPRIKQQLLEGRGHKFSRYADDCNIYIRSRRAGARVLASVSGFVAEKLKLKVNEAKSGVARPWKRSFLGYSFTCHKQAKLRPHPESVKRFRGKVRELCRKGKGRNLARFIEQDLNPLVRGWGNYFGRSEVKGVFEQLDSWIRRRLRCIRWRQWKHPATRLKKLLKRGLPQEQAARSAYNGRGPWWNSGASHRSKPVT